MHVLPRMMHVLVFCVFIMEASAVHHRRLKSTSTSAPSSMTDALNAVAGTPVSQMFVTVVGYTDIPLYIQTPRIPQRLMQSDGSTRRLLESTEDTLERVAVAFVPALSLFGWGSSAKDRQAERLARQVIEVQKQTSRLSDRVNSLKGLVDTNSDSIKGIQSQLATLKNLQDVTSLQVETLRDDTMKAVAEISSALAMIAEKLDSFVISVNVRLAWQQNQLEKEVFLRNQKDNLYRAKALIDMSMLGEGLRIKQLRFLQVYGREYQAQGVPQCNNQIEVPPDTFTVATYVVVVSAYQVHCLNQISGQLASSICQSKQYQMYGLVCQVSVTTSMSDMKHIAKGDPLSYLVVFPNVTGCVTFDWGAPIYNDIDSVYTGTGQTEKQGIVLDFIRTFVTKVYPNSATAMTSANFQGKVNGELFANPLSGLPASEVTSLPPSPGIIIPGSLSKTNEGKTQITVMLDGAVATSGKFSSMYPFPVKDENGIEPKQVYKYSMRNPCVNPVAADGPPNYRFLCYTPFLDIERVETYRLTFVPAFKEFVTAELNEYTKWLLAEPTKLFSACYGPRTKVAIMRAGMNTVYDFADDSTSAKSLIQYSPEIQSYLSGRTLGGWLPVKGVQKQLVCGSAVSGLTVARTDGCETGATESLFPGMHLLYSFDTTVFPMQIGDAAYIVDIDQPRWTNFDYDANPFPYNSRAVWPPPVEDTDFVAIVNSLNITWSEQLNDQYAQRKNELAQEFDNQQKSIDDGIVKAAAQSADFDVKAAAWNVKQDQLTRDLKQLLADFIKENKKSSGICSVIIISTICDLTNSAMGFMAYVWLCIKIFLYVAVAVVAAMLFYSSGCCGATIMLRHWRQKSPEANLKNMTDKPSLSETRRLLKSQGVVLNANSRQSLNSIQTARSVAQPDASVEELTDF
jgi:hypothetical protein